ETASGVPGAVQYGDRTVAEHAFALMLAAARDVAHMDRTLRDGRWQVSEGLELQGRTLGLIGLGGIGCEMARLASAFGLRVIAWNRSGVPAGIPAETAAIDVLLAQSDVVSLHLGLNAETREFLNRDRITSMKPGAILINTARAGLVDGAALVAALKDGRLAHAALDVFDVEPLPVGHVLATLSNVTLTAHAGWKSRAASRRLLGRALGIARDDAAAIASGASLPA
ncbi:MAG: NAD(P)-dependent oxidoreductase, partial [Hyphomicrobiaceae bacterium]